MRTSCASDFSRLLARRPGRLPELPDEDARPALLDVIVYDGFGNPISPPGLPARFAYTGLEELAGEGLHAAAPRCYNPTPGRWLDLDPVGFETGDTNLYRVVSTEPGGILLNEDGTIRDA
jgi:RHS repeat-associated protein